MVALSLLNELAVTGGAFSLLMFVRHLRSLYCGQSGLLGDDGCIVPLIFLAQARTAAISKTCWWWGSSVLPHREGCKRPARLPNPPAWRVTHFQYPQMYYNMRIKTLQQEARAVIEQADNTLKVPALPPSVTKCDTWALLRPLNRPMSMHCVLPMNCVPGINFGHTTVTEHDLLFTCRRGRVHGMQAALQPIRDAEEQLIRELKAVERDLHASPGSSQAQALQQKARGLQEAINAHVEHVSAACLQGAVLHAAMQCLSRRLEQAPAARLSCFPRKT